MIRRLRGRHLVELPQTSEYIALGRVDKLVGPSTEGTAQYMINV